MVRFNVRGRAYRKLHGGLFATANPFRRSGESVPWRTGDGSILLLAGSREDRAQVPTALFQLHARRIVLALRQLSDHALRAVGQVRARRVQVDDEVAAD